MSKRFSTFLKFACASAALALTSAPASATTLNIIKSFCGTGMTCTGSGGTSFPQGLLNDGSDNYFGVLATGGANGKGEVFRLSKSGGSYLYADIYDFCGGGGACTDGRAPTGKLIIDSNGVLYGVAENGGPTCGADANGCGVIYTLTPTGLGPNSYSQAVIYDFCGGGGSCTDGKTPAGELTYVGDPGSQYDGSSALFGATLSGGANSHGAVFKLTGIGGTPTESVLYSFCPGGGGCTDGAQPNNLVADGGGSLYGTTPGGGNGTSSGVVYELDPNGGSYTHTTLWTFCGSAGCPDGQTPDGQLVINGTGKLLGTTAAGGAQQDGTVFRITPNGTSSTETVRYDFCSTGGAACTDGALPRGGVVMDANGDFYGVTGFGGNQLSPGGTVFKLHNTTLTTLYKFCPGGSVPCTSDGNLPQNGVALDASGNVYGTATYGGANGTGDHGGTAWQLIP